MMDSNKKIYDALELAFASRKDDLGKTIIKAVEVNVQELRELDMNVEELTELRACYDACYEDSMGSLQAVIALAAFFVSLYFGLKELLVKILNMSEAVVLGIIFIIVFLFCVYAFRKINKITNDITSFRNYKMASSILLAEKQRK